MYASADHDISSGKTRQACIARDARQALQPLLRTVTMSPSLLVCLDRRPAASVTVPMIQEVGTSWRYTVVTWTDRPVV